MTMTDQPHSPKKTPQSKSQSPGLVVASVRTFRAKLVLFLKVVSIVALPSTLISTFIAQDPNNATPDTGLSVYLSIATLLMNLALVWVVSRIDRDESVTLSEAYYKGTASIVRFILVALVLTLSCLPAAFALLFYNYGTVSATAVVSAPEKILLGFLALLFAMPTVILLPRLAFALQITVDTELSPLAALKRSWVITRKRLLYVLSQLLKLIGVFIIIVIPIAAALAFANNTLVIAVLDFLVLLVLLPFMNIYLYKLYRTLPS